MSACCRGQVVVVDLDPKVGAEKKGTRPCLVVQNDVGNKYSPLTIIVTITDRNNVKKMYPTLVEVKAGEGGLSIDSIADCGQIYAIDKSRIVAEKGIVSDQTMQKIQKCLKISLDLT